MSNPEHAVPAELLEELRTPEERAELVFKELQKEAADIATKSFSDHLEATMALDSLVVSFNEKLNTIDRVSLMPFQLSGEGVSIPEYSLGAAEDEDTNSAGIAFMFTKGNTMRSLETFETVTGAFEGVAGSLYMKDDDSQDLKVRMSALFNLAGYDTHPVLIQGTDIAVASIVVRKRAVVDLSDDFTVISTELEKVRKDHDIVNRIARSGLTTSMFVRQLNKMRQALHNEDTVEFKPMDKISVFQQVGALGGEHARKSDEHRRLVTDAIMALFGESRTLKLEFTELIEGVVEVESNYEGVLTDTIFSSGKDDDVESSIVIQGRNGPKIIPFSRVTHLNF
jgi:hypothetical protein